MSARAGRATAKQEPPPRTDPTFAGAHPHRPADAYEDPFGMHLIGDGASAKQVRDPIVRGAAAAAQRLPAEILQLRKLASDYQVARGALDGDSVAAIGLALANAFADAEATLQRLDEGVGNADLLGAVGVEYSWDPTGEKDAARADELTRLKYSRDDLAVDLASWATLIANAVRPASFRHQEVPGIGSVLRADDMPGYIREQTAKSILLLDAVDEITILLAGAEGQPLRTMAALRIEAANRLQFWVSDRDGFLFLAYVLRKLGHADLLDQRGNDGNQLTRTVDAVQRGVPQNVADVIATVREARSRDLAGDRHGAIALVEMARARVDEIATYEKVAKAIPKGTHGLTLEHAWHFAQDAQMGLEEHWGDLKQNDRPLSEGLWNLRLRQLEVATQILSIVTGETAYEQTIFPAVGPASKTSMIGAVAVGGMAIGGAAAGAWLLAHATAVAEIGAGTYAAAVTWIVRNPQTSTALAEFAGSIGLNIIDAGGIENFLEGLKTPEGALQMVMEILIVKQAAGGGARGAEHADAPDAPRRVPDLDQGSAFAAEVRDVLDRARAFKAATVEWSRQGSGTGPSAATTPALGSMYAEQLDARRAARATRGDRGGWPSHEEWDAAYQAPPAGKTADDVREKLVEAAQRRYPATDDLTEQDRSVAYAKQQELFERVEQRAIAKRDELHDELARAAPDEREHLRSELERAEIIVAATARRPEQRVLPGATRPAPSRIAEAKRWAEELAETAPKPDAAAMKAERENYERRQNEIRESYDAVMSGESEPPPGVTRDRLKLAVEGEASSGQRVPLTFESPEQFAEFQTELRAVFAKHGITDAVVQQLGSGTTGWRGNPTKPFGPWKRSSDVDFAIFSDQALVQVQDAGVPINTKITQGGRYTVFKNDPTGGGFYATPLGKDLEKLAKQWNVKIYGAADAEGFDFKMNLINKPFARAISVMRPEQHDVRPTDSE